MAGSFILCLDSVWIRFLGGTGLKHTGFVTRTTISPSSLSTGEQSSGLKVHGYRLGPFSLSRAGSRFSRGGGAFFSCGLQGMLATSR